MYAKERIQYVPYVKNVPSVPYNGNVSQMKKQYSYVNIYIYLYSALSNFYKELKLLTLCLCLCQVKYKLCLK